VKMALCLAGKPSTMEFCYPSIKEHILDVYNPDVFVCSDEQRDRIDQLYNPVVTDIYAQEYITHQFEGRLPRYTICQTEPLKDLSVNWKVRRCGEELKLHEILLCEKYDVVAFSRFDVKFLHIAPIEIPEPNTLYMPTVDGLLTNADQFGLHFGGYSTQLCWMSSDVAQKFSHFYDHMDELYQKRNGWHNEVMFKMYCDQVGIIPKLVDISMMIIRGTNDNPLATDLNPLSKYPQFM
jgi:hypothetical protein